ncbi:MAG: hypothetical protein EOM87_02630, partial [Clostridia bacterium]|nr:hypothetical protein [Clostridia bacterium]
MIVNWTDNQKLAINEESRDLIVTASAGSGKTSAMVARALALIKKGVPVTRLMLLTFGEAAAAEMREKLRNALIDYAKVAVDNIDFIREQIDDMARTDISTIHSFCKGIIKNNFETVGLSPGFEVSDKETAEVLARKAIKNLLEAEGAKKNNTQFAELREMLSPRNDDTLIKIIRNIYDYMATQADRESWLNNTFADEYYVGLEESAAAKYTVEFIKKEATIISSRAAELQKSATFLGEDIYINNSQYLYERVCGYLNCISLKDIYIEREREYIIKWRNLRDNAKNSSLYKITQELKEEVSSFNALIRSMLGDYSYEEADSVRLGSAVQVSELIRLVKAYDVEFSKIKRENNVLDFADLEKFALLVLNNQQKREEIVKEHDYVFVDEYQDTNFVQESIISKVAPENALFMVGDSKQCIYRFRLAEPNIFLDKLKQLCQQGKAISFNDNFRSSPLILGFVNDVFGELMTEGLGGVAYAKDAAFNIPKEYHRVSAYPEVQISAVISARDEEDEEQEASQVSKCVYSVKEAQSFCSSKKGIAEGREIAAKIMSLVGREHINDKGVIRLIEYSDIALMFKQRSNANGILSELTSCSIPLRLGVFAAAEQSEDVALLINYIKFLNNRKEDYTLIAVMHSRLCNFSNEELAEIRRRRDKIPFYQAAELCAEDTDSLGSKLKDFYNAADNYCFEAQFTNVNALIASIIEQSGYGDYVLSLTGGKDRMIALEYFLRGLESKSFCRSV